MNSFNGTTPEASRLAKLELNAKLFEFNQALEDAANLYDSDPAAWQRLPVILQDRSGMYRDARAAYRAAVRAGAIADDRNAATAGKDSSS